MSRAVSPRLGPPAHGSQHNGNTDFLATSGDPRRRPWEEEEISVTPRNDGDFSPGRYRRELRRIQAGIAPILWAERPALALCGRYGCADFSDRIELQQRQLVLLERVEGPRNGTIDIVRRRREVVAEDGTSRTEWRASVSHAATCKNPHVCASCSNSLRLARAEEVNAAIAAHGVHRTLMLTLTTRHYADDSLVWLLQRFRAACKRLFGGELWRIVKRQFGIVGQIRALEVTHGTANGWHPHQHRVLFISEDVDDATVARFEEWFAGKWAKAVAATFGKKYEPSRERGTRLTRTPPGEYLCKLGLELIDIGTKRPKGVPGDTRRTFFEIARDATDGDVASGALVREYAAAIYAEKHIHWSQGLKERFAAPQDGVDDEQEERVVVTLSRQYVDRVWALSCSKVTPFGVPLVPAVLEAVEAYDADADARAAAQAVLDQVEHHGVDAPQASLEAAEAQLAAWGRSVESARVRRRKKALEKHVCKNSYCVTCFSRRLLQAGKDAPSSPLFKGLAAVGRVVSLDDSLRQRAERAGASS